VPRRYGAFTGSDLLVFIVSHALFSEHSAKHLLAAPQCDTNRSYQGASAAMFWASTPVNHFVSASRPYAVYTLRGAISGNKHLLSTNGVMHSHKWRSRRRYMIGCRGYENHSSHILKQTPVRGLVLATKPDKQDQSLSTTSFVHMSSLFASLVISEISLPPPRQARSLICCGNGEERSLAGGANNLTAMSRIF
jgi:hypothetical protein